MSDAAVGDAKKKERSPSFPSISLGKAIDRARLMHENYRKEPVRVSVIAGAWGYGSKSSGLLQTVATLKQYGLVEDSGSGDDRKIQLTPLALRILLDSRPGQRETAVREAATRPRLFSEYVPRWASHRPPDEHRISELALERGFSFEAAKLFLRAFDETVSYAGLGESDGAIPLGSEEEADDEGSSDDTSLNRATPTAAPGYTYTAMTPALMPDPAAAAGLPFSQRLKVEMTVGALRVSAILTTPAEVDRLVQFLQANKLLLETSPTATDPLA